MRVDRSGSERWLVVPEPPEKVWPIVKDFWQGLGFVIKTEVPEAGVMETDWAENRAKIKQDPIRNLIGGVLDGAYSTGERDKFRTRLERGAQPSTTEIYITHRGVTEVYVNQYRDSTLGRAADSWRTAEARDRRLSGNDCEIHGTPRSASIADVAHVLTESHRPDRGGRERDRQTRARGAVRPGVEARGTGARSRGLHRRGPRPLEGFLLRAVRRS